MNNWVHIWLKSYVLMVAVCYAQTTWGMEEDQAAHIIEIGSSAKELAQTGFCNLLDFVQREKGRIDEKKQVLPIFIRGGKNEKYNNRFKNISHQTLFRFQSILQQETIDVPLSVLHVKDFNDAQNRALPAFYALKNFASERTKEREKELRQRFNIADRQKTVPQSASQSLDQITAPGTQEGTHNTLTAEVLEPTILTDPTLQHATTTKHNQEIKTHQNATQSHNHCFSSTQVTAIVATTALTTVLATNSAQRLVQKETTPEANNKPNVLEAQKPDLEEFVEEFLATETAH